MRVQQQKSFEFQFYSRFIQTFSYSIIMAIVKFTKHFQFQFYKILLVLNQLNKMQLTLVLVLINVTTLTDRYTHTCTHIHTHLHTYIHTYIHTYTHMHTHTDEWLALTLRFFTLASQLWLLQISYYNTIPLKKARPVKARNNNLYNHLINQCRIIPVQ